MLATQAKPCLQTPDLAVCLVSTNQPFECLFEFIEVVEIRRYSTKKDSQVIQELNFYEDFCNITRYITKGSRKLTFPKIMTMAINKEFNIIRSINGFVNSVTYCKF